VISSAFLLRFWDEQKGYYTRAFTLMMSPRRREDTKKGKG